MKSWRLQPACFFLATVFCALPGLPPAAPAAPPVLAELKVGDVAPADILAPVEIVVTDPVATAALREKEALKVPALFRFDPEAGGRAVTNLLAAFTKTRADFLTALESGFGRRRLGEPRANSFAFRKFRLNFLTNNPAFPIPLPLAQTWALGKSDYAVQTQLVARLRAVTTNRYIRADELPAEGQAGPLQVRLLPVAAGQEAPDLAAFEQNSIGIGRNRIAPLARVKNELQKSLSAEERPYNKFLATFLQPNCFFDAGLTRQARARRSEPVWSAERYQPGQVIVQRGEIITPKIKAALDQLAARDAMAQLRASDRRRILYGWLLAASAGLGVIYFFTVQLSRRRRTRWAAQILGDAPARGALTGQSVVTVAPPAIADAAPPPLLMESSPPAAEAWQQQALAAEQRAAQATQAVRAGLIPHLAQFLKQKLVRGLIFQRAHLLEAQKQAAADMAELEERLARIHAPLQDRLNAYEKRIADLESELVARGEENRELISATIQLARQKLEAEKSRPRATWN